jgi:hypothetical protein
MTASLEEYKLTVEELRAIRADDEAELEARCAEVEVLRSEVDKLGAEVIQLRAVVEDSVRERREVSVTQQEAELEQTRTMEPEVVDLQPSIEIELQVPRNPHGINVLSPVPEESTQQSETQPTHRSASRLSRTHGRTTPVPEAIAEDQEPSRAAATVGGSGRTANRFIDVCQRSVL